MIAPARAHFGFLKFLESVFFRTGWEETWLAHFQCQRVWGFPHGRDALLFALSCLAKQAKKTKVIFAAYTCPSIFHAVRHVGLLPVMVDLDPKSGTMDLSQLTIESDDPACLAVICANLYGIPDPMAAIKKILDPKGITLIEDLSLALGALPSDSTSSLGALGQWGDLVFLSLGMSKVLTTLNGGILLDRKNLLRVNDSQQKKMSIVDWVAVLKQLLFPLATSRFLFGIVNSTPLGVSDDLQIEFSNSQWSQQQAKLSGLLLESFHKSRHDREINVKRLNDLFAQTTLKVFEIPSGLAMTRFPVMARDTPQREELMEKLFAVGFQSSRGFIAVRSLLSESLHPCAIALCERLFTVPCHSLTETDLKKIAGVLRHYQ